MKRILFLLITTIFLTACGPSQAEQGPAVCATTLPVFDFSVKICQGTPVAVTRLITEEVSCLHDYSLNVRQVKAVEAADAVILSGAGLEDFLRDLLADKPAIDASSGIELLCPEQEHDHGHEEEGHHHESDPHIWLSPANAKQMSRNICHGLTRQYPEYSQQFQANLTLLLEELDALESYAQDTLAALSCRELITFHDGFAYLAQAFDLHILQALEEESGSEASARELIHLIEEVEYHSLPAIFTEKSGSVSAAAIIARETGCKSFALDMAMAGDSYFDAMYHNIDTLQEALG